MTSKDKRAFFQVDVGYFDNPKMADIVEDNPRAVILHLRAIAYCAQHLTDGIFPMRRVMRFADASQSDLDSLVHHGLVIVQNDTTALVHDYLEHQRSAASIGKAKAAGQRAAAARWDAEPDANRIPNRNTETMRDPIPREKERKKESSTRAKPKRPLPEDWEPNDKHSQKAGEKNLDVLTEAEAFRDFALANDRRYVNWNSAFNTWLGRAYPKAAATTSFWDRKVTND